jgi:hypothetical protein
LNTAENLQGRALQKLPFPNFGRSPEWVYPKEGKSGLLHWLRTKCRLESASLLSEWSSQCRLYELVRDGENSPSAALSSRLLGLVGWLNRLKRFLVHSSIHTRGAPASPT